MAYAAIIGTYLEAAESHLTAERARKLVGHIGHEVNTPAIILGQKAIEATYVAKSTLPAEAVEARSRLDETSTQLKYHMGTVSRIMSLASLVGQWESGHLQINFAPHSLLKILRSAKESLHNDMVVKTSRGVKYYDIALGPSCERAGEIICDDNLLIQVFVNLFANGMKYSLPRYSKKPMTVDVVCMPQTGMTILQVTNWGLGIPPDDFDRVFSAFTRGSVHDTRKAIPGMGLGLYICQCIISAHKGRIYCHHSTPTLDDPERCNRWEGYETTFEVRLPHSLTAGVIDHEFGRY
jgi:two-component system sensor histidine kinase KdpD